MSLNPVTPKRAPSAPAAKGRSAVRVQRWLLVLGCLGLAALALLPVLRRPVAPGTAPTLSERPLETSTPTTTPTDPSRSGDDTVDVSSTTSGDPPQTAGARQSQRRTPVSSGVSQGDQVAAPAPRRWTGARSTTRQWTDSHQRHHLCSTTVSQIQSPAWRRNNRPAARKLPRHRELNRHKHPILVKPAGSSPVAPGAVRC